MRAGILIGTAMGGMQTFAQAVEDLALKVSHLSVSTHMSTLHSCSSLCKRQGGIDNVYKMQVGILIGTASVACKKLHKLLRICHEGMIFAYNCPHSVLLV